MQAATQQVKTNTAPRRPEVTRRAALPDLIKSHLRWLKEPTNGARADLSRMDLAGLDLSGINLSGAVMVAVDCRGAKFRGANLTNADLFAADLTDADLSSADLQGSGAVFWTLDGANLANAIWVNGVRCLPSSTDGVCNLPED